jgi:hypothetical protein
LLDNLFTELSGDVNGTEGEVVNYFGMVEERRTRVAIMTIVRANRGEVERRGVVEIAIVDTYIAPNR